MRRCIPRPCRGSYPDHAEVHTPTMRRCTTRPCGGAYPTMRRCIPRPRHAKREGFATHRVGAHVDQVPEVVDVDVELKEGAEVRHRLKRNDPVTASASDC
eukprot:202836-Chlamydomonas_euryale.AAC.2